MINETFTLTRDCPATMIPAGDTITLAKGTTVTITQALGNSITVSAQSGLFRIDGPEVEALGEAAADAFARRQTDLSDQTPFGEEKVWNVLRQCFDPEIPVNIVDLGLIYHLDIQPAGNDRFDVSVKMTLTAQGCGMGPVIASDAKAAIESLAEVNSATVDIVWDPPWNPSMISPEGRYKLGLE